MSRSTVRQFYIYFGLFQTCADFKSILIYLFYALVMVNIFPSANVPGQLKDGAVPGGQPAGVTGKFTDFPVCVSRNIFIRKLSHLTILSPFILINQKNA